MKISRSRSLVALLLCGAHAVWIGAAEPVLPVAWRTVGPDYLPFARLGAAVA